MSVTTDIKTQTASKRTPLYSAHIAAQARMVDFSGWEMPVNYGSQIEEHHLVRKSAGMFDVSHMRTVDLYGERVGEFLRYLLANDVAKLTIVGKALYSCMLNENGGVIDDLIACFLSNTHYRLVINAGTADKDIAWISKHAPTFNVEVKPRPELAMVAIQGPQARELFWQAYPAIKKYSESLIKFQATLITDTNYLDWFISRTGYTGEDGFEVSVPKELAVNLWDKLLAVGVKPCGLGARDTLRLEAGMNLYGQDMDELTNPLESGLGWTIDMKDVDRNFIGKAVLTANTPQQKQVGLILSERGVLRAHLKVKTAQGLGETTSGTMSPTLGQSIAFARIPKVVAIGECVEVEIRDKWLPATVVKTPFYKPVA